MSASRLFSGPFKGFISHIKLKPKGRHFMKRREFLSMASALSVPVLSGSQIAEDEAATPAAPRNGKTGHDPLWTVSSDDQKVVLSSESKGIAYQTFVRKPEGSWVAASLAANPLLEGPSFGLADPKVVASGTSSQVSLRGTGHGKKLDGRPLDYTWRGDLRVIGHPSWFRFEITLDLPAPLMLQQHSRVEPQIILWLTSTSTMMEGQALSWRRVLLHQPTQNSLGTYGNDLPAVYLLDKNSGIETMMYFDMSVMDWMSFRNLPRFLVYRCTMTSRLEPGHKERIGLGLVADQAAGNILPPGKVRFAYNMLQRPIHKLIDQREAVQRWMEALLPLFEERLEWPLCATTWKSYAAGMVQDVQKKGAARIEVQDHTGLRAYVKSTSKLWKEPSDNFELMTLSDVLWPSLLYARLHPSPGFQELVESLLKSMPAFYVPKLGTISNSFIHGPTETVDSWYYFENGLVKYSMIGQLAASRILTDNFLHAFDYAGKLASRYDCLFPIYYDTGNMKMSGAGTNYAVGGLYAWAGCLAHHMTGEPQALEAAKHAIQVLGNVPAERLFHEPQELAFGAMAAAHLGSVNVAHYLLYEQLRLFYWYSDPSQKNHDIRGMVQACASILYPAFKENVESILPWTAIMKRGIVFEGLLRFMDQMRRNNFYFFQNCYRQEKSNPLPYIPYENLATLELGGHTGSVGKEIYGSGEVIWMYLMFEALGTTNDRDLLLVNLDLPDIFDIREFPPRKLNFILFNPTETERKVTVSIPVAKGAGVKIMAEGQPFPDDYRIAPHAFLRLKAEY